MSGEPVLPIMAPCLNDPIAEEYIATGACLSGGADLVMLVHHFFWLLDPYHPSMFEEER